MCEEVKSHKTYSCIRCNYTTPFKHNYIHHLRNQKMCKGTVPLWDEYIKYGIYHSYQDIMEAQQRKIEILQEEKSRQVRTTKYYNAVIDQGIIDSILDQKDIKAIKNESWKCLVFFSHVIHHLYVLTKCVEYKKTVRTETLSLISHKKQNFSMEEGIVKLFHDGLTKVENFEKVEEYVEHANSAFNEFQDLESEEINSLINAFKHVNIDYLL